MLMPVYDMFRWFVPMPILDDAEMSMLWPLLAVAMFDGSIFSFLFWCSCAELPVLEPLLQMPFSICFFCAMPELMLLITLFTPPTRYRFVFGGMPEPDLLDLLSLDDLPCPAIILAMESSPESTTLECAWLPKIF